MKKAMVLIALFLFFSCDLHEPDYDLSILPAMAHKIVSVNLEGRSVAVEVSYSLPSPLYSFYTEDHSYENLTYTSKLYIYSKKEPKELSPSALKHSFEIKLQPGLNTLRFWRSDKSYLETTVEVE